MPTASPKKKIWEIQGWDSTTLLFQYTLGAGQINESRMAELLRALTAKISLNEQEIISSYVKKGTQAHQDHLQVQRLNGNTFQLSCGTNPYVTATIRCV